jgi:hypothetical protein
MRSSEPQVARQIRLDDGSLIVLLDMLAVSPEVPQQDVENNIQRVTKDGQVIWCVSGAPPVYSRSPFTGMALNSDHDLIAYRWDGGQFKINIDTGVAEPVNLAR